ncbi:MAG: insulinase family protein [Burkholderiales bacterium]|nr:insulinase family protein [Phycisphaerae bacterium]
MTILAEKMAGVRSAAMTFLVPAGGSNDPIGGTGCATVLSELVMRGAGSRDSREFSNYLDTLGLQRSSSASSLHTRFGAAALPSLIMEGLGAYADIVRRAHLPEEGFEAARDLALQSLAGVDDEPRQKLLIRLRECYWPWPYGRNVMGNKEDLTALTYAGIQEAYRSRYNPGGAVLSIAGDVDFASITDRAQSLFGDWPNQEPASVPGPHTQKRYHYEYQKSEQTHIGIAYRSVSEMHQDYYSARLAIEVLAGGMSGRLFTEIREKKGLVYSVSGSYSSLPGMGAVFGYAGTSNERAQQTLDQLIVELKRMSHGVTQAELDRAKIGLKASTIMSGESTTGRAAAIAHDHLIRGRIRSMDEIIDAIGSTTLQDVNDYLQRNPAEDFTVVTVGPKELVTPS